MYTKKIADFIYDVNNKFQENIIEVLKANKSVFDDNSEIRSWEESLPVVAGILDNLSDNIKNNAEIVLEAKYEIEEKRADVVIAGTKNGVPALVMIENKRWSNLREYHPLGEYCVADPYHDNRPVSHPCRQVDHYKKTLTYTNGYVQENNVNIVTAVLLQNAVEEERTGCIGPFSQCFNTIIWDNPVFIGEEGLGVRNEKSLCEYIEDYIDDGMDGLAQDIYKSEVCYSADYIDILANVMGHREELISLLDDKQIELFDEITRKVYETAGMTDREPASREKTVYIVEGSPGTGKTFAAVALLSYLYQQHTDRNVPIKAQLLLKNRDPRLALEREMGIEGGAVKFGLRGDSSIYDCLICDESHRNLEKVWKNEDTRNTLEATIQMGKVSVFFYDSRQHVHINDYVTKDRIIEIAGNQGVPEERIIQRELVYQHRCKTAEHFLGFVDRLLYHPENGLNDIERFNSDEDYQVALVDDPQALFTLIREKNANRNDEKPSRVLAGKGRTFGRDWSWWWNDEEIRATVGPFRNMQGAFTWNKREYIRPQTFASDEGSIGNVGCIDTSQGLDFEYVGIIIAPDLVYDIATDCVKVDISGHQQEDPNTGLSNHNRNENDIIQIIKNTYRVLLSRGEKGCYLYCCDENLQEYLKGVLPVINVPESDEVDWAEIDINNQNASEPALFIGNNYNNSFHTLNCKYAPKSLAKRVEYASREAAVNAGYRPCPTCNP